MGLKDDLDGERGPAEQTGERFPVRDQPHCEKFRGNWEPESSGSFEKRGSTESPAASLVRKGSSLDF